MKQASWVKRLLGISDLPKYTREEALERSAASIRKGLLAYFKARAPKWKAGIDALARKKGVDPKYLAFTLFRDDFWPKAAKTPKMRFLRQLLSSQGLLETKGLQLPASEDVMDEALLHLARTLEKLEGDVQDHFDHKLVMPEAKMYKRSLQRDGGKGSLLHDAASQISAHFKADAEHNRSTSRLLVLDALQAFDL